MKSEQELIGDSLAGVEDAYRELVERFSGRLYNAMLHVIGSHEDAEDVVQETFVQAYIKLNTFQGKSQFFTWLYRIAFNNVLSRGRRRHPDLSLDAIREQSGLDPLDQDDSPDDRLLRQEEVHRVRQALQTLSEEHRSILILREMQDMAYEDIAQVLDINIGTVRSRLSRARAQMKSALEQIG